VVAYIFGYVVFIAFWTPFVGTSLIGTPIVLSIYAKLLYKLCERCCELCARAKPALPTAAPKTATNPAALTPRDSMDAPPDGVLAPAAAAAKLLGSVGTAQK
jgi:hypothetical protein